VGPVPGGVTTQSTWAGEVTIAWEIERTPQRTVETTRVSSWEALAGRAAAHGLAKERPRIEAVAISPFSILAPVVESDAMLIVGILLVGLTAIPTSETKTLAIDPSELSLPLDVSRADPKLLQLAKPASDSALLPLGRDDRQLSAFHFTDGSGSFPVGLLGMIQITRPARSRGSTRARAGSQATRVGATRGIRRVNGIHGSLSGNWTGTSSFALRMAGRTVTHRASFVIRRGIVSMDNIGIFVGSAVGVSAVHLHVSGYSDVFDVGVLRVDGITFIQRRNILCGFSQFQFRIFRLHPRNAVRHGLRDASQFLGAEVKTVGAVKRASPGEVGRAGDELGSVVGMAQVEELTRFRRSVGAKRLIHGLRVGGNGAIREKLTNASPHRSAESLAVFALRQRRAHGFVDARTRDADGVTIGMTNVASRLALEGDLRRAQLVFAVMIATEVL